MTGTLLFLLAGILLTILMIVGVHEFGHFLAARLLGIRVVKFSLGFGRELISFGDSQKTRYSLSAIPLGGYVSLLEENDATEQNRHEVFNRQPFWKRFIVIAAGPLINLLFSLLLYWVIFMVGFVSILPITGTLSPDSIAAKAGLKSGQQIITVDERDVKSWTAVMLRILDHVGRQDTLKIQTKNLHTANTHQHILDLHTWTLDPLKPDLLGSLGLSPWLPKITDKKPLEFPKWLLHENKYRPLPALVHAWQNTHDFSLLNLKMILKMVEGKLSLKSLGGPVSIFGQAAEALHNGVIPFLSFVAFLSIAVGIINILPIPGLDGGHLLFQTIEWVTRRPISSRLMALFQRFGIIFIVLIAVQAILNDLMRLK